MDLQGYGQLLLSGLWVTIELALVSLFFGLIIGLCGASARLSASPVARAIATTYTTVVRGIPELLLVLTLYFGGSQLLMWIASMFGYDEYIDVGQFAAAVAALAIAFGAYSTEVFRMAMMDLPKGQWESAAAMGMTPLKTFVRIIMPQVWRLAIPGLGNLFQVLLKDTALVSVVGLNELMRQASVGAANTKQPFDFYLAAALLYLLLTVATTLITGYLERRSKPELRGTRA
ncbi:MULTISPECIES: ABC transporter permease [unclassified Oceanobacter]|uniref:ABC transporter permease n=1 Tax=unclassified Oceanobacter TaxID=2620260 RepID=UPI0027323903|nr:MULTISPECIES: ABC transporter permease subunit [unclassified Oceanobacter]MDP2547553.1 ABC transporter permease subunit [Oceanobacter sp. 4_MG-2023]MDP2608927.1 ABC transporter permease subunit [Oceanobacter sp. 1_MG-2023]MDP2612088.1 ABC transporter permease subunit [Oceanobacter sp. 2_MG-2023]